MAPTCWSAELLPSEVARTLDITSFRNSIRPGLKPGTETLAQNEFTEMNPVEGDANSVEVWLPDRSWLFEITVLRSEGDKAVVCILDKAENGGTYLSLEPLELWRSRWPAARHRSSGQQSPLQARMVPGMKESRAGFRRGLMI